MLNEKPMRSAWLSLMLVLSVLLTSCQSVPRAPQSQLGLLRFPDLEPMVGPQEPDFTVTMDCFLQGKLSSGSTSDCSETPATSNTGKPKPR